MRFHLHRRFYAYLTLLIFRWVFRCVLLGDILRSVSGYQCHRIVISRTDTAVFHNPHKPPVGIAVVKENHSVSLCCIGLSFHSSDEVMKRIYKFEIDILCSQHVSHGSLNHCKTPDTEGFEHVSPPRKALKECRPNAPSSIDGELEILSISSSIRSSPSPSVRSPSSEDPPPKS